MTKSKLNPNPDMLEEHIPSGCIGRHSHDAGNPMVFSQEMLEVAQILANGFMRPRMRTRD